MRANEFITEVKSISKSVDGGSLTGYVTNNNEPQLRNYLTSQGANSNLIDSLYTKYESIAIIRNMYVDEEYRGQGIGTDLISDALNDAALEGAEVAILVADIHEDNNFDLAKWYEDNFEFEKIGYASGDPIMLKILNKKLSEEDDPDITKETTSYQPPELEVGDKILKGKFKNSPAEIKGFKKDRHNQPVLQTNKGDVQLFKPRVAKLMKETINKDILHRNFKHQQQIGDYTLKAKSVRFNKQRTLLLRISCYQGKEEIGFADFEIKGSGRGSDSTLESDFTWVATNHRQEGIASIMYAYAKMLGNDITPSSNQLPPGKKMWDAWKKSGEAAHLMKEEINPDILHPEFKHQQVIGDYTYTAASSIGPGYRNYLVIKAYEDLNDPLGHVAQVKFFIRGTSQSGYLESLNTWVAPEYRGKGIASTIYTYARMLGNTVNPSSNQTGQGRQMWDAWKKSGDAEHLMKEAAPAVEKPMTQCTPQDLQKLLGKGKLNALVKHPWFQQFRNYEHAFKHGVDRAGFTKVEVYCFFRSQNTTAEGKIRPLIMLEFTFSYNGTKVIQVEKYHRDKEPNEYEKRIGRPSAGWRHIDTWAKDEQNTVEKAWDKHWDNQSIKEEIIDEYETGTDNSKKIFDKLKSLGYEKLGSGLDATVWAKDENHVIKILMPSRTIPGTVAAAERGFLTFYNFCKARPELPNLPKFIDIGGEHHTVFELGGIPYRQIAMEKLQPIKNGSFEEAMVWILSDLASSIRATWTSVAKELQMSETWQLDSKMSDMPRLVTEKLSDPATYKQYGILFQTMGRLYQLGLKNGLGWDLHTENAMQRKDGTIVIVDPYYT